MRIAPILLAMLVATAACARSGGSSTSNEPAPVSPTAPSPPVDVTGAWRGPASDSSGPGQFVWVLTQTNASFTGTVTMTDAGTGVSGRGTVSGSLSSGSIHYSIGIPAGGFDNPYAACTATVSGDGQVSSSSITGTYTGSNSCTGSITGGQVTLSKQ